MNFESASAKAMRSFFWTSYLDTGISIGGMHMLLSQKLQLEMSEKRKEINAMVDKIDADEGYDADAHSALNQEYVKLENRYQSALISEQEELDKTPADDLDGEGKEVRGLEHRVSIANYMEAALNDAPLTGAEKELQDALGIAGVGTQVPWIALLSPSERTEHYAATSAPDNADVVVESVLGRVFAQGAADYLGVRSVAVPVGAANFPVLSNGVVPANADKGGSANQTAATLTANVLNPLRLTSEYLVRYEDLYTFRAMEDALRSDLAGAMTEARDKATINGSGTGQNVNGFLSELSDPTNPTDTATFATYASARAGLVDGRYAMSEDDVRILVGNQTYSHAAGIYQTGSGASALARLNPRVSAHMPAASSNIAKAIASRSMGRAVAPMWPSIALIRDNISRAGEGEITITAIAMWNFKVLDESGYSILEFKIA